MNTVITGGAGYVGIQLAGALLHAGHRVTIFDNFLYGYDSVLHLADNANLEVVKGDVRNPDLSWLDKQDIVFHLAAVSGAPACQAYPASAESINVEATDRIVKYLSPNQRIVFASTTSLYGISEHGADETAEIKPTSVYTKTKYRGEQIVMEREASTALRFATIFGLSARMRGGVLVQDFVERA